MKVEVPGGHIIRARRWVQRYKQKVNCIVLLTGLYNSNSKEYRHSCVRGSHHSLGRVIEKGGQTQCYSPIWSWMGSWPRWLRKGRYCRLELTQARANGWQRYKQMAIWEETDRTEIKNIYMDSGVRWSNACFLKTCWFCELGKITYLYFSVPVLKRKRKHASQSVVINRLNDIWKACFLREWCMPSKCLLPLSGGGTEKCLKSPGKNNRLDVRKYAMTCVCLHVGFCDCF